MSIVLRSRINFIHWRIPFEIPVIVCPLSMKCWINLCRWHDVSVVHVLGYASDMGGITWSVSVNNPPPGNWYTPGEIGGVIIYVRPPLAFVNVGIFFVLHKTTFTFTLNSIKDCRLSVDVGLGLPMHMQRCPYRIYLSLDTYIQL